MNSAFRNIPWVVQASLLISVGSPSYGQEFKVLGLRPLGMGGAGVAVAEGGLAQYWNPGNLAFQKGFDLDVGVNANVEATGNILNKASQITDAANQMDSLQKLQGANGIPSLQQVQNFYDAINKINAFNKDGSGVLIGVQGGGNAQAGRLAASLNNFTEMGGTPFFDTRFNLGAFTGGAGLSVPGSGSLNDSSLTSSRDQLAQVVTNLSNTYGVTLNGATPQQAANYLINTSQTQGLSNGQITTLVNQAQSGQTQLQNSGLTGATGLSLQDNQSNVTLRGASLTEAAIGYGYPVVRSDHFGELGLGVNFKMVRGQIGYDKISVFNGQKLDASTIKRDFVDNSKTTYKPAVDAGVQWKTPWPWHTRLGVVGRNLNSPTFDQPAAAVADGEPSYKEDLQARAGLAVQPLRLLTLASDVDITKNATEVPGFASRQWGAGAELNLWLIKLRAGVMNNLAGGTPLAYTGGVGLRIFMVALDIGASVSSKTVTFSDGTTAPSMAQVGANLSILFGR